MNASPSFHVDAPATPRAVSADPAASFVQLPYDFPKVATLPRTWAYASPRVLLDVTPPLFERQRATLVAALVALLQRYAQQSELRLDLAVHIASLAEATCGQVDFALDDQQTLASVVALAEAGLATLPSVGEHREQGRSNVALTLLRGAADLDASSLARAHDLHFVVHEDEQRVALRVAYDENLFRAQTVERLVEAYVRFLHEGWLDAESALFALPVLSGSEVSEILLASEGRCSGEPDQTFMERFEANARTQPDARAVSYRDQHLSYGELDARAEQLANYLSAAGVRAETRVAVCLTPSLEVVIALLAIFKVSAVYVPLDPTHPSALLSIILDEVSPRLVLTDGKVSAAALSDKFAKLYLDRDGSAVAAAPARRCTSATHLDAACYVLYTSGTTGRPKGVLATHRNLGHYLRAARERYEFTRDDVFCSLARYTFSISFFELLSPLASGGRLLLLDRDDVLDPARLVTVLAQVTVLHAGPSLLGSLFRHLAANSSLPRTFANVRHASSGGDLVGPQVLEEMKQVFCDAEIFVIYGCTEIACMGMTLPVSRARPATRHMVGRPFADVTMRVLDAHGRIVPFGVVGEIHFAGKGIARRYLDRPALTSEKFVCIDGQRFYKTGDLGRLHTDGNLEILGRRDFQVQLRGIRIELAGIEQIIRELGLAAQTAVIAAARDQHDVRLVAFVVSPRIADTASFRKALALSLPDYMVPQAVVELEAFPLTANGKLDRMRLRELAFSAPRSEAVRSAPETVMECTVAEAFASVLGVSEVGVEDDFFDLGGHSLTAVLLLSRLQDKLGLSLSPALLFEHTTVRGLSCALAGVRNGTEGSEHLPILLSQSADQPALFMLLGVHLYRELARELAGRFSVYGVYAGSELDMLESVEHAPSVPELAREYVALIRRVQPTGPYRIGGMSFGGIVAYEAAQQLEDEGEEVASLLLLDAVLPETMLTKLRRMMELPGRALVSELSQRMQARLSGLSISSVATDFNKYQDDPLLRPLEDRRQDAYRSAAVGYMRQIRPFHGDATLVVAGKRLDKDRLQDPACGFSARVSKLRVHAVEAEHLELLEQPRVAEVAQLVLEDLRRSGTRSCVPPRAPALSIAATPLKLA